MLSRYDWQPGNNTRYDLMYGTTEKGTAVVSWLRNTGAGGPTLVFRSFLHYSYMMEKMQIRISDAVGILKFLEEMGHKVGYPDSGDYTKCTGKPYINVLE